jgi:hypothetical protein
MMNPLWALLTPSSLMPLNPKPVIIKGQNAEQEYKLMKKWNLPDQYCQAAKEHHDKKFNPEACK